MNRYSLNGMILKKSLIFKKSSAYLALIILGVSFAPPAIASCILVMLILKYFNTKSCLECAREFSVALIALFFIGAVPRFSFFLNDTIDYFYLRDGFYFLLPIVALLTGISLCKNERTYCHLITGVVAACVVITSVGCFDYFMTIADQSAFSLAARYESGLNSGASTVGLIVLLFNKRYRTSVFSIRTDRMLIVVFFLVIVLSLSRTNILITFCAVFFPVLNRWLGGKSLIVLVFIAFCMVVFLAQFIDISTNTLKAHTFYDKLVGTFSEMLIRDLYTMQEINNNWRAYEAFLGLNKYLSGTVLEYIYGHGFGSYVSASHLFDNKFEIIPIFHNGFVTVLLKTGLTGVCLYHLFFLNILVKTEKIYAVCFDDFKAALIKMMCISLLIKTFFVMGIYTPKSQVFELIIIGASLKGLVANAKRRGFRKMIMSRMGNAVD